MKTTFLEALKNRRSIYALGNQVDVSQKEIILMVEEVLVHMPSAFNSQTTRLVLLFDAEHTQFWDMVKSTLRAMLDDEAYAHTEKKIDGSFRSGFGTILFFEDQAVVGNMQKNYSAYADRFPQWSEHTSAMHQFALWTLLEDAGLGASLQHYNPLIDDQVRENWTLPSTWKLIAQMPFGKALANAGPKMQEPLENRMRVFK